MNLRTPAATKVIGALGMLLIAGLGWVFVLGPEVTALSEVRAEVEAAHDQNDVLELQLVSLQRQAARLGDTEFAAESLAVLFPPTAAQPDLFASVTAAAVDAGIGAKGVTTLAPAPPVLGGADVAATGAADPAAATGDLARQVVTVSVEGTYAQTQQLLENLEQMPRAYLVTSVTLSGGAETAGYVTTVAGQMFVMPPVPAPEVGLDERGAAE
ncbi:hypothetical protein [Nocardioides pacificus]